MMSDPFDVWLELCFFTSKASHGMSQHAHMTENYPKYYLYKRIVQAKLFIDSNFSDPIDLNNISDEACYSKFHFLRLFRKIYGRTPHQYLISVRVENAKLFLQKDISVGETCFLVGFESVGSFTELFKKYTKQPPSVYQQKFKERKAQIRKVPLQFIPNCFAEQKGWTEKSNFQEVQ